jgi:hypothetical protein
MNYDFGNIKTVEEVELLNLQIEEYKRIMFKYREQIVQLRKERDAALEQLEQLKSTIKNDKQ